MMNGTIFLAKQKHEYKHLTLYMTFTYIKFICYCFTAGHMYPHQAQIFTWWWDKVAVFL